MSPINLADVMDELAARLDTIDGLRSYEFPADSIAEPAAVLSYPERYQYDETYGRGMDRITDLPVVLVVGKPNDRSTRDRLGAYTNGSGPRSVKATLEAGAYTAFDTVRVVEVEFDVVRIAGTDYMAALFKLDIAGQGAG